MRQPFAGSVTKRMSDSQDKLCVRELKERRFAELYLEYVSLIQKYEPHTTPVHLCFAPIGTNLVLLANEVWINSKLGRSTKIIPGVYAFDEGYIRDFNRAYGTNYKVLPWVLQRFGEHYDNPEPWTIWFKHLNENDVDCADYVGARRELEDALWSLRREIECPRILELGLCLRYVSRFNDATLNQLRTHDYVTGRSCTAVHIRRGDACDEELKTKDPGREHFPLERYIEEMESYFREGKINFYIMTESAMELERLAYQFQGRCNLLSQRADRSRFPSLKRESHGSKNFIEYLCLDNPALTEFVMSTAIVDIYNASQCDSIIAAFSSQFSCLNYLSIIGHRGRQVPFTNLTGGPLDHIFFYPNLNNEKHVGLIVIRAKHSDFFSSFLSVCDALLQLERQHLTLIPYVSVSGSESQQINLWNQFFEQPIAVNPASIEAQLQKVQRDFSERTQHFIEHRDMLQGFTVCQVDANVFWLADESPIGVELPNVTLRKEAAEVIGKFVAAKPEIWEELERGFKHRRGAAKIGVLLRKCDVTGDRRLLYGLFESAVSSCLNNLEESQKGEAMIFIASDDAALVALISDRFQRVFALTPIETVTSGTTTRSNDTKRWVLDYLALCNCDFLVHTRGSLSKAVLLTRPAMKDMLVDASHAPHAAQSRLGL